MSNIGGFCVTCTVVCFQGMDSVLFNPCVTNLCSAQDLSNQTMYHCTEGRQSWNSVFKAGVCYCFNFFCKRALMGQFKTKWTTHSIGLSVVIRNHSFFMG